MFLNLKMCNITDYFSSYEALCQSDLRRITDFLSMIQQDRCAPCTSALRLQLHFLNFLSLAWGVPYLLFALIQISSIHPLYFPVCLTNINFIALFFCIKCSALHFFPQTNSFPLHSPFLFSLSFLIQANLVSQPELQSCCNPFFLSHWLLIPFLFLSKPSPLTKS